MKVRDVLLHEIKPECIALKDMVKDDDDREALDVAMHESEPCCASTFCRYGGQRGSEGVESASGSKRETEETEADEERLVQQHGIKEAGGQPINCRVHKLYLELIVAKTEGRRPSSVI
jgi:hypothetical protein